MTKGDVFSQNASQTSTLVDNIEKSITNPINATLIWEFYQFMKTNGTSESYQKNNLKVIINFAKYQTTRISLYDTEKRTNSRISGQQNKKYKR